MPCPRHTVFATLGLDSLLGNEECCGILKKVAIVAVAGVCIHVGVKHYLKRARENRRKQYKKDTVILHQYPRSTTLPALSVFAFKLETYLRVAQIPYEVDTEEPFGPKGQSPWITYNGEDIPDSEFCIEYLNRKLSKNLNAGLTPEQLAVARILRLAVETNFLHVIALWRFLYDKELAIYKLAPNMPFIYRALQFLITNRVKTMTYYQGIGRHSQEEVIGIGISDLNAFSAYLGKKDFFMGDHATEVDCALFAHLAQVVWGMPGSPFEDVLNGELTNLKEFCERMKAEFWKDWDKLLLKK